MLAKARGKLAIVWLIKDVNWNFLSLGEKYVEDEEKRQACQESTTVANDYKIVYCNSEEKFFCIKKDSTRKLNIIPYLLITNYLYILVEIRKEELRKEIVKPNIIH